MTTRSRDDELFDLVRAADPLGAKRLDPDEELLQRLLTAARLPSTRRRYLRTSLVVRTAVCGVLLAGVAFTVVNVLPSHSPGVVAPASAEATLHRAAAALAAPAGAILHVEMTGTQTNPDGTTVSWWDESWQQTRAPFNVRNVQTGGGSPTVETATMNGHQQLYDPDMNTIYSGALSLASAYTLSPGRRSGSFQLRLKTPMVKIVKRDSRPAQAEHPTAVPLRSSSTRTITISAAQAQALENGSDTIIWKFHSSGGAAKATLTVAPISDMTANPDPISTDFRQQILALLNSGSAQIVGPTTIDGQVTLEIRSRESQTVYYVNPSSYAPVALDTSGNGGSVRLEFTAYEQLPDTPGNEQLLTLSYQHPNAITNNNPDDYQAAEQRLFPRG